MRFIYRESRNFNTDRADFEKRCREVADSLMNIACGKYKNVYYIHPSATSADHETSVDGTHGDYGYTLWEKSIEKQVLRILKKYQTAIPLSHHSPWFRAGVLSWLQRRP